jgi:hypothetical protein
MNGPSKNAENTEMHPRMAVTQFIVLIFRFESLPNRRAAVSLQYLKPPVIGQTDRLGK